MIGSRLQRTKAACGQRYARLKEKAQLAASEPISVFERSNRLQVLTHTSFVTQKICPLLYNCRNQ